MADTAEAARNRASITLADLVLELVWPRLFRAAGLALRPARIGLATFHLIGAAVILLASDALDGSDRHIIAEHGRRFADALLMAVDRLFEADATTTAAALLAAFVQIPAECVREAPFNTIATLVLLTLWTAIMGGAICRTAATEIAWSRPIGWPSAIGMGLSRWRSLAGALVLPMLLIWVTALGLSVAGWALFSVGVVSVAGGLLWMLFLIAGLVAALIVASMALGHAMLVPAVVCEGADAIDAVQHAFAVVLARPLRLAAYILTLAIQGVVFALIVLIVAALAIGFAKLCAGAWLDPEHRAILGEGLAAPAADLPPATGAAAVGRNLVQVSTTVFQVIAMGAIGSFFWCAATLLFLAMRRVCDGQEMSELWSPGAADGQWAVKPAEVPASVPPRSEAVLDNGPADEG